jgi:hypothetical protein
MYLHFQSKKEMCRKYTNYREDSNLTLGATDTCTIEKSVHAAKHKKIRYHERYKPRKRRRK